MLERHLLIECQFVRMETRLRFGMDLNGGWWAKMNFKPFIRSNDVNMLAHKLQVPRAKSTGILDGSWLGINVKAALLGYIQSPLPIPPDGVLALGYDEAKDQIAFFDGSAWRTIG